MRCSARADTPAHRGRADRRREESRTAEAWHDRTPETLRNLDHRVVGTFEKELHPCYRGCHVAPDDRGAEKVPERVHEHALHQSHLALLLTRTLAQREAAPKGFFGHSPAHPSNA